MPGHTLSSLSRVRLVTRVRQTGSGSEAFLGLASDGQQYWVKAPDSPQGPRALVAEVIAYGIGRAIGAPVPANVLVESPGALGVVYADGRPMSAGIGHGSLNVPDVIESDDWGTYSQRDDNRRRQAFILAMWDFCMGVDPQWLHQTTEDYSIWSFDHGLWLAGETDWDLSGLRRIGTGAWPHDIDAAVASSQALNDAATQVAHLGLETIQAITGQVPLDWNTTPAELREVASLLYARVPGVTDRLRAAAQQSRYP